MFMKFVRICIIATLAFSMINTSYMGIEAQTNCAQKPKTSLSLLQEKTPYEFSGC